MAKYIDLFGKRNGKVTVLFGPFKPEGIKCTYWYCYCDCGRYFKAKTTDLKKGTITDCGCEPKDRRLVDLSGQRFGKLLVQRRIPDKRDHGYYVYECKCDCGNTCEVSSVRLRSGRVKDCGCVPPTPRYKDFAGKRFGMLTVVKRVENKNKQIMWLCRCDCGNELTLSTAQLQYGRNHCGNHQEPKTYPLVGKRFGKLQVVGVVEGKREYRGYVYKCLCDCGNTCEAGSLRLQHGTVKDCGCVPKKPRYIDLTGQRFGMLTVLDRIENTEKGIMWRCRCDCGEEHPFSTYQLRHGGKDQCGNHPQEQKPKSSTRKTTKPGIKG